ncbi:helix-turn-helix domain-containing protein [Actinoplanes sp. NPDC051513]|uniref:helix-turn-helix domain-containing protein n=1 Tax=Actinoplanes sp. NPDC051513 TaxID=3363908 RepID=UPI0037BB40AB
MDNELGLFLRSRRETIGPAELGLPAGARRRTPGLRRTEVAAIAGVSVEYVTRLEQGKDRHPSAAVLAALAGALRLSASERVHLYRLSKGLDPGFTCRGDAPPAREVRDPVRAILMRLDPSAAVVANQLGDLLAWTSGFEWLAGPAGILDGDPPNLNRYVFTDRRARTTFPDWELTADERVAELKQGPFRADRHLAALADELTVTAGEAFERRTREIPGLAKAHGIQRWNHPGAGELRMAFETLELPADDGLHLVIHLPADGATEDAIAAQRPTALRLVAG